MGGDSINLIFPHHDHLPKTKKILELIDTWLPDESSDIIITEFKKILGEAGLKFLAKESETVSQINANSETKHCLKFIIRHLSNPLFRS